MTVLLRADANAEIGIGHVMRCVSLGIRLINEGHSVHLASAEIPETVIGWISKEGIGFSKLPFNCTSNTEFDVVETCRVANELGEVEWVVVDHYGLDARWENSIRANGNRVMVIDDLADRSHDCDVLLDPGMQEDRKTRYEGLVPEGTAMLLGPEYALLRPEFDDPAYQRSRSGRIEKLLVYLGGGAGIGDEILKILSAIAGLRLHAVDTTVVLGPIEFAEGLKVRILQEHPLVLVLVHTGAMASLMRDADLAIGTCGSAGWERCALGVPALTVLSAENQRDDTVHLAHCGAIRHLGDLGVLTTRTWRDELTYLMLNPSAVESMGRAASTVLAGRRRALRILEGVFNGAH